MEETLIILEKRIRGKRKNRKRPNVVRRKNEKTKKKNGTIDNCVVVYLKLQQGNHHGERLECSHASGTEQSVVVSIGLNNEQL